MHEVLSFELGCSEWSEDEACDIEWWQSKDKPNPGDMFFIFLPILFILTHAFLF